MQALLAFVDSFDAASALSADTFFAASELAMVLPAAMLATLPFWDCLRWQRGKYVAAVAILTIALLATAPVLAGFNIPTNNVLLPALGVFFAFYVMAIDAPLSKKAGVFLSVTMFAAFVSYVAIIVDAFFGGGITYFALPGTITQWSICAVVIIALARPMYTKLPAILDGPATGKRFWELFWILPLAMTCALVYLVPEDASTLLYRRVGQAAIVGVAALFFLTVLSYALFIRLANQASATVVAQKTENDLRLQLLMQSHLEERIDDARRARHDLRQHNRAIRGFIDEGDMQGLTAYLDERESHAANLAPIRVCENPAVNAVAVYYWDAALHAGAAVDMRIDLPRHPSVPEDDLIVVFGNLLENAVEALLAYAKSRADATDTADAAEGDEPGTADGGSLLVHARRDAQGAVFIRVSNTCVEAPIITPDGIASTKHAGQGLGTQSICNVAKSHNGTATFSCKDGVFTASVMLGA